MRIRATEASRNFSELLTRVAHGESIEVDRHGQVVAIVSPPRRTVISGRELIEVVKRLPVPDADFAADVASLDAVLTSSSTDPWQF